MGIFNLKEQFTFYAQYHNDSINQYIHIACVWPILWTAVVMLYYPNAFYELPIVLPAALQPLVKINVGFVAASVYFLYYPMLDRKAGMLGSLLIVASYLSANCFAHNNANAWKVALPIHIFCWIAQFVGHGMFEGRSPALLDNLAQALLMAPLFVLIEVLMKLGFYSDFHKEVQVNVDVAILKWKAEKAAKKAGAAIKSKAL